MNGPLDPNVIAAEFLKQNIDSFFDTAKQVAKGANEKIRLKLDRTYQKYLTSLFEKHSKMKSFLLRGEAVPLHDFYIPLNLLLQRKTIEGVNIRDIMKLGTSTVITGSGGSGKTMLVRHLLLDSILTKTRVPIFVELRQLNTFDGDLFALILQTLNSYNFTMDKAYIVKALELGHFVVFLDGYDEVVHNHRHRVKTYILDFVRIYAQNTIVLTSRPDPELEGWQAFTLLKVAPLTLLQADSLVEKLPFDDKLKATFQKNLRAKLFLKHESFLSNPLLLSIMLLSYGQSASIPSKLSVFYNQAYEALFERHDVLKEGFKRQLLTSLDIQDFARLFAVFCLQTYDKKKIEFTQTEALEYIETSQSIVGIQCSKKNYLGDLIQAVCLMLQDGLQIVFAHRSFQEYFAARFICEANSDIQRELISKYSKLSLSDRVFDMLYEMRPEIIEQYYIRPGLDNLFKKIGFKRKLGVLNHERFVRACCSVYYVGTTFSHPIIESSENSSFLDLTFFTLKHCGHLVNRSSVIRKSRGIALARSWNKKVKSNVVMLKKQPTARQFIRELATSDSPLSLSDLKDLFAIRSMLDEKAKKSSRTLESILKNM